eukprot:1144409-Pelagomonas_calceolata.AAC.12
MLAPAAAEDHWPVPWGAGAWGLGTCVAVTWDGATVTLKAVMCKPEPPFGVAAVAPATGGATTAAAPLSSLAVHTSGPALVPVAVAGAIGIGAPGTGAPGADAGAGSGSRAGAVVGSVAPGAGAPGVSISTCLRFKRPCSKPGACGAAGSRATCPLIIPEGACAEGDAVTSACLLSVSAGAGAGAGVGAETDEGLGSFTICLVGGTVTVVAAAAAAAVGACSRAISCTPPASQPVPDASAAGGDGALGAPDAGSAGGPGGGRAHRAAAPASAAWLAAFSAGGTGGSGVGTAAEPLASPPRASCASTTAAAASVLPSPFFIFPVPHPPIPRPWPGPSSAPFLPLPADFTPPLAPRPLPLDAVGSDGTAPCSAVPS